MLRLLHLLPLVILLAAAAHAGPAEVRCAEAALPPLGCPDLVPDGKALLGWSVERETFPRPDVPQPDCALEEGLVEPGERTLLRFATTAQNVGPAALVLGDPAARPDWYAWSPCHNHYHFGDFAHYRLWTPAAYAAWEALRVQQPDEPASALLAAHPDLAAGLRAGHKQGFCIIDGHPMHALAGYPEFGWCARQGISPGWQDTYGARLDGQWIDVTGVAPGAYVLEVELNPERRIEEADDRDNTAVTLVTLT